MLKIKDNHHLTHRRVGPPVLEEAAGQRIDRYLAENYPFRSRVDWNRRLRVGLVCVAGKAVKPSYLVKEGDSITNYYPQVEEPPVHSDIVPIYKRGGVMAVYKPPHLPMHENGPYRFNTFAHLLQQKFPGGWSAVHRLDRETSGIVLCGNNHNIRRRLSHDLLTRRMDKEYLAIARGAPREDQWIESGPIGDLVTSQIRIKKWVTPSGAPAQTSFRVLKTFGDLVLVSCSPKTGRTNQIRIHLAVKGLPILGDKLYHPDEQVFLRYLQDNGDPWVQRMTGCHRLCLHAYRMGFHHPEDGSFQEIICPLPDALSDLLLE